MERVLAVILAAISGLVALFSLIHEALQIMEIASAFAMISTSLITMPLPTVALLSASLALSLSVAHPIGFALLLASGAIGAAVSRRVEPLVISVGLGGLSLFVALGDPMLLIVSLLSLASLAAAASGRPHSLVLLPSAAAPIVAGPEAALMISILLGVMYLWLTGAGGPSCPFRRDSRLAFYGTITSVAGIVLHLFSAGSLSQGLWLLGLMILISGIASPAKGGASPKIS